jgi:cellulose synthase/poly-beta-1,6-N-acetylglucosamine synthase-like glycosyltransferase
MIEIFVLWLVLCFLSFGILGFHFILMRKKAKNPWELRIDKDYAPKVSILVPTYNESDVIHFKLENLNKIDYPRELFSIIIVDSNSNDGTIDIVNNFAKQHPEINIKVLVENQRRGKSAALNFALKHCNGDVVIVSDADCFWPSDILHKTLPFLADPDVGAISGPKILLNPKQSWITKTEDSYLDSINLMKLGESKAGSTLFFEGGFSAYKREVLEFFDPYKTGSDDCGTIIKVLEKNFRAIMVPEAEFFTVFPKTWNEKIEVKIRRANQLIRVFRKYASLLLSGKMKTGKWIIIKNLFVYFLAPFTSLFFVIITIYIMFKMPVTTLFLLLFLIPKVRNYLIEATISYLIIIYAIILHIFGKKFIFWKQPQDRVLLTEEMLIEKKLI